MTLQKFLIFLDELSKLMFPWEQTAKKNFTEYIFNT